MKVIVVGGGASGFASAIMAARNGADVVILERNKCVLKKLLVTGNGKCNYYNADQRGRHYHSSSGDVGLFLRLDGVLAFFDSLGVIPYIKNGYYYPYSNQASAIVNALINEAQALNIKIVTDCFVRSIKKENDKFRVLTVNDSYVSDKVIIATGSYAYYRHSDINSYDLAGDFLHTIIKPRVALVQLKSDNKIVKKLAGVRANVLLRLVENGVVKRQEEGEMLFTSYGISGICAMQLSRDVAIGLDNNMKEEVLVNLVSAFADNVDDFRAFMESYSKKMMKRTVSQLLDNFLNYKLGNAILEDLGISSSMFYYQLSGEMKQKLCSMLVAFPLNIVGTNSFLEAQVCSGGVSMKEINPRTMESLLVRGLYIIGELLDVDGDCGGYNLTWAWNTGLIAGSSCVGDE